MNEDRYFNLIRLIVNRRKNIDLSVYRKNYLLRRIRIRMFKTGCENISEYYALLLKKDKEIQKLIDTIGVNVSRFYRDKDVFNAFYNKVLPYLKTKSSFIKGWSAGCAGGEEVYTLAIMLFDFSIKNFEIIGTDFDEEVIEVAQKGIFEPRSFEEFPLHLRIKYIDRIEEGKFRVKDFVKEHTQFVLHNLLSAPPAKNFDVILCRNVLIYMQRDAQKKVFENLTSALNKGGVLVLGKVEMIYPEFENFYEPLDLKEKIFRKIL